MSTSSLSKHGKPLAQQPKQNFPLANYTRKTRLTFHAQLYAYTQFDVCSCTGRELSLLNGFYSGKHTVGEFKDQKYKPTQPNC